jgi:hypothetical protein
MTELDQNYNIVTGKADPIASVYDDELNQKIDRIMKLKETGKISPEEAKILLKQVMSIYFEEDVKESFEAIFPVRQKKNKMLFLRYLTEELYA